MVDLLIDYSDPEALARQNVSPNAGCHVGGKFYDVRNLLHLVRARDTRIAELEAEVERLTKDVEFFKQQFDDQVESREELEALSRTGAVKVKALEWTEEEDGWWTVLPITGLPYEVRVTDRGTVRVRNPDEGGWSPFDGTADEAKAAAQADYERRILSALEPAAPEGQQDAVATVAKVNAAGTSWNTVYPVDALDKLPIGTPLYTRPSEQAVTEAMVERALIAWFEEITWSEGMVPSMKERMMSCMSAALKAAMEAGRHD